MLRVGGACEAVSLLTWILEAQCDGGRLLAIEPVLLFLLHDLKRAASNELQTIAQQRVHAQQVVPVVVAEHEAVVVILRKQIACQ